MGYDMEYQTIVVERKDRVGVIVLNRPILKEGLSRKLGKLHRGKV